MRKEIIICKQKVIELEEQLTMGMPAPEMKVYKDKMEDILKRYRVGIANTKKKKWFRDLEDYNQGKIFQW